MADVDVKIEGLDEVLRKMRALADPRLTRNAAKRASRKAMNIVKKAAIQNAKVIDDPETREAIYANIAVAEGRTRDKNLVKMRVGVNGGAGINKNSKKIVFKERKKKGEPKQKLPEDTIALKGGDTRHWKFVEFGTSEMPATPFMRPALANNVQQVTDIFSQSFNIELEEELSKL
ncbi:hypothetical protein EA756_08585 [Acinetobacter lactucae]|uniref:HK97 gp10 family phage protein n=1 Tax=Acinetobacter lactucae TaxID=1785128 RepID=A0A429K153_9GAMM|nr:HK97-gp10 family putative phage morphogenesis protein [Acinetobacter lactucae]RSO57540.1 hypothetical protein EA756_08585 [Acinetobacter lactucae]